MSTDDQNLQNNVITVYCFDTQLCADSVEWCPLAPYQRVFVLGTYEVVKDEDTQATAQNVTDSPSTKRHGRLFAFEVKACETLEPLFSLELPAILDMKWSHVRVSNKILLAVATSVGQLLIYELKDGCQLDLVTSTELTADTSKEVLALSLDWSTGRHQAMSESSEEILIIVSDSQGYINVFSLNDSILVKNKSLKGHDYEAWIVAFDYWNPSVAFSGGDDCKLCIWDIRSESSVPQKRVTSFDAGVTSLHSNALHENILACGSYDEKLRIWDTRRMKQPLAMTNLEGGIWRVKWDPEEGRYIIAACMYNGVHILDCEKTLCSGEDIMPISHSTEHKSIAYGGDWCYLNKDDICTTFKDHICWEDNSMIGLVATCSFYDKQLHVSLVNKMIL